MIPQWNKKFDDKLILKNLKKNLLQKISAKEKLQVNLKVKYLNF